VRAGDASDRGQPKSRAVGILAEERTEDSREVLFRDASTVVFDFDHHFPARSILTVAFAPSHDHGPVSVNSFSSVKELKVRNLRSEEFKKMSDAKAMEVMLKGKGKMEGYEKTLGEEKLEQLLSYCRELSNK